ncbi:MAG: hypothetical protein ACE5JP_00720 [Candidatus Bipolaricaulia bacterium]
MNFTGRSLPWSLAFILSVLNTIFLVLPVFAGADLTGISIGIDLSHNQGGQQGKVLTDYTIIQGDLESRGATIAFHDPPGLYPFAFGALYQHDIWWIEEDWESIFPWYEKTGLAQYVQDGGCLFLNGDQHGLLDPPEHGAINALFGFPYGNAPGNPGKTQNLSTHPITLGVFSAFVPGPEQHLSIPIQLMAVRDLGGYAIVGIATMGQGRVIVSADEKIIADPWINLEYNRQLANNIFDWCVADPIELVGLEVNQSIQDLEDSVFMVKDKTTIVRAHIKPRRYRPGAYWYFDLDVPDVVLELNGWRNGKLMPYSPLQMICSPSCIGMVARANALKRRENFFDDPPLYPASSANFLLPPLGCGEP